MTVLHMINYGPMTDIAAANLPAPAIIELSRPAAASKEIGVGHLLSQVFDRRSSEIRTSLARETICGWLIPSRSFAALAYGAHEGETIARVHWVGTIAWARRRGYARALVARALDRAAILGFEQVHMWSTTADAGVEAFYQSLGFRRC